MTPILLSILTVGALISFVLAVLMYLTTFTPELWYQFKFYVLRYKFKGQRRIKYRMEKANETN